MRLRPLHRAVAAAVVAAVAGGAPAAAQTRPGNAEAMLRQLGIATWSPALTQQTVYADEEVVSLADDGRALWLSLMARPRVVRFEDGAWHGAGEIDTQGVYFAYAVAVAGADVWAVGHEGGMARRRDQAWQSIGPVTPADLYAVTARGPDDVWAVGFDYTRNAGVVVRWDGRAAAVVDGPPLDGALLFSAAHDPSGALWIGGCTAVADAAPLLWRQADGTWLPQAMPVARGCVTDLAFAADGRALAAAGSDLVAFDGARWTAFGLPPPAADPTADPPRPEGLQWMRVALAVRDSREGPVTSGAAIAGRPTFRGFTAGAALWRYDGTAWRAAAVDDRGWDAAFRQADVEPPRDWLDVVARRDGAVVAAARLPASLGQPMPTEGLIGLFALEDDGFRLVHPLAGYGAGPSGGGLGPLALGGDVAATPARNGTPGQVWLATALAGRPIRRTAGDWTADADFRFAADGARWFIDAAGPDSAAAWRVEPRPGTTELIAWRGAGWQPIELPGGGGPRQVRDVGGGRLWARRDADLLVHDGRAWSRLPEAPPLSTTGPVCTGADVRFALAGGCEGLTAPFDAVAVPGGGEVGWVAGADGALHPWAGGRFAPGAQTVRGAVLDLQLVGPRAGWAIGRDESSARPAGTPRGVVLRLTGTTWAEVSTRDLAIPRGDGSDQQARIVDVEWRMLAAVDANEAVLYGVATFDLPVTPQELPVLVQLRGNRAVLLMGCPLNALAAARADGVTLPARGADATDIWLLDQGAQRTACTRSLNFRLPIRREPEPPVTGLQQILGQLRWALPAAPLHLPIVGRSAIRR